MPRTGPHNKVERAWVSQQEAARLMQLGPNTVARYIEEGRIQTITVRGFRKILRTEIDRWLKEGDYRPPDPNNLPHVSEGVELPPLPDDKSHLPAYLRKLVK